MLPFFKVQTHRSFAFRPQLRTRKAMEGEAPTLYLPMSNPRPCRRLSNPIGSRKARPSQSRSCYLRAHRRPGAADRRSTTSKHHLCRSSSEPILWASTSTTFDSSKEQSNSEQCLLLRPRTCLDIFLFSSPSFPRTSLVQQDNYGADTKVVINVIVEGSPGPVRAMVRMGASVEETIKIVVGKYEKEGRQPVLGCDASNFVLHSSYFSLSGLNKTDRIGEVGSRSFYLRKSCCSGRRGAKEEDRELGIANLEDPIFPMISPPLFTSFVVRRMMGKISRRIRKLLKLLGCFAGC